MVEPTIDYPHQRYLIDVAEEVRIDQFDILLV
jgi:hypothetical protein